MLTLKQSNFLKLIGIVAMVLDHLGSFFYPSLIELRIIGRIAFPLFAYQLAIGSLMTSDKVNYIKRLFSFAIISQIPYYFLNEKFLFNILFSLAFGVLTIYIIEKKLFYYFLLIIPISFVLDYQIYGLLVILIFYFIKKTKNQLILFLLITVIYSCFFNPWQIFSIISIIFILKPFLEINLPKSFFYLFYPAHLFLFSLIKILLNIKGL
jgi:hypothetical protein